MLDHAIQHLKGFESSVRWGKRGTRIGPAQCRRMQKSCAWFLERDAVVYALFQILRRHSSPRLTRGKAFERIGIFLDTSLPQESVSPHVSLPRQMLRFQKNTLRVRFMDELLRLLI